ncbi:SHOCT domain-containing protein [Marinobacterium arenosum]|uniref:SHOCT domain-containing protein n=1 Tax=Marinobacterium arenosum TaxID=2862496 RepID=UPI001C954B94|nr:SHOCT domain-containing protein [Marinobacterium arenosum]MBY4677578.1 SHOCT domain-containing protein [Marinobacterium arenosum]
MFHGNYEGWMFGHGLWMLFWLVVLLVIVWLVARAIFQRSSGLNEKHRSALEILDERLARGDIDEAEYRRRKSMLEDNK